jgi:hypothetical protein
MCGHTAAAAAEQISNKDMGGVKEAREKESSEKEDRQPIWMVPIPIGEFDAKEDKKQA